MREDRDLKRLLNGSFMSRFRISLLIFVSQAEATFIRYFNRLSLSQCRSYRNKFYLYFEIETYVVCR